MSKLGCDLFSLESKVIIIGKIGVIGESFVNAIVEARGIPKRMLMLLYELTKARFFF